MARQTLMQSFVFENKKFKLTLTEDGICESLISLESGEECISGELKLPVFKATQLRPYNNEIKLIYTNKRTSFGASRIRLDGEDRLIVKFGLFPFEAVIKLDVKDSYMSFTLLDFIADKKSYPRPMDYPPVYELSLLELPTSASFDYGQWMNVCHTGKTSFAVMATSPAEFIDSEVMGGVRILKASCRKGIKLKGASCVLIASNTDTFLDSVRDFEVDFGLPHGVDSRRSPEINRSAYWVGDLDPKTVDRHIELAKLGGFTKMLIYYTSMCKKDGYSSGVEYRYLGDYSYDPETYPRGEEDLRLVIDKVKAAGIDPGFHILHTHIGIKSHYVTPEADRRLHLLKKFTLSRPLSETDTTVYVDEKPTDSPTMDERSRILRVEGEIISYESYTEEPPYAFVGCKRGHFGTTVKAHPAFIPCGVLDLSEYAGQSIYLDQETDFQEEIAESIARIYDFGFKFFYFDGSEGTNAPYEYHIPNAQYRVYKKMATEPIYCEGAAKAHFGWHMLSGGNAFDYFPTEVLKEKLQEFAMHDAVLMQKDFTRVNFGWWELVPDSRVDIFEYCTSKAAAFNCPSTLIVTFEAFDANKRSRDIFEMFRRWEDVRVRDLLTDEDKEKLKDAKSEYTLLINKDGEYELTPYFEAEVSEGYSGVRAFVFERAGLSYAVIWDDLGESSLTLKLDSAVSYTKEVDTEPIAYKNEGGKLTLPVSDRAYLAANCTLNELRAALKSANVNR